MNHKCAIAIVVSLSACVFSVQASDAVDIHAAARLGNLERVIQLLDADAGLVNARTDSGETPLLYAAGNHQTAVVRLLLERGADVNAADRRGRVPLHFAATAQGREIVDMLLAAGAQVNVSDADGETPLHVAARRLSDQSLRALVAAGADVNARNGQRKTPLQVLGSTSRCPEQTRALYEPLEALLIENGATPAPLGETDAFAVRPDQGPRGRDTYHTYAEIMALLQSRASSYPTLCQYHELGNSVQSRKLMAVNISDNVGTEEDEPEFKYVSTMHGDEVVGSEMCLFLIDHLLTNYGSDPDITDLVDELDIWIMPLMNPDGYVSVSRYNANGVDLNRNFPEWTDGDPNTTAGRQPETAAVMNWTFAHSFSLSANIHTGTIVANYPYDDDDLGSSYSASPDDDMFIYISEEYSQFNPDMWGSTSFFHGITNGAAWYTVDGGMQDWHYRYMGDNEVTLEISYSDRPSYSLIPGYWEDNRDSMLAYMSTALMGVRGIVTDGDTGLPLDATITVVGREDHEIYTDPDIGDYHRMLMPGTYELVFDASGYTTETYTVTVNSGDATRLDVALGKAAEVDYPNGGEQFATNQVVNVTWDGDPAAQFTVQYTSDYGQTGTITDDFERTELGPDYTTVGSGNWFTTTYTSHGGSYSARAGDIGDDMSTCMIRTADEGPLSFWYRVSSESGYDYFNFYIGGSRVVHQSGTVGWTYYSTTLSAGQHELKWEYDKDGGASSGSDTVWIDDLSLVGDVTVWNDIVALTATGASSAQWTTPAVTSADYKVRVRAVYTDAYGEWDESDAVFEVVEAQYDVGDMNCDGSINNFDIDPFTQAISDPSGYEAAYPACYLMNADCNQDGSVNNFDIDPFVALLSGG